MTFHGLALEGVDSVHFALALKDYDLLHYRPHFPGYPVYLAMGWLILQLVGDAARALTLTAALLGSLTLFPLYILCRRLYGDRVAALTALLFIVNPLLWLESSKAYSDTSGLFFLVTALTLGYAALANHRAGMRNVVCRTRLRPLYWGSVIFGVMLGVRLAYLPFVCTWGWLVYTLCRWRTDRLPLTTALNGIVLGVGLWLVPFLLKVGLPDMILAAKMNTVGTVYQYGHTLVTSPDYLGRAVQLYGWNLLVNGLGFWWPDTSPLRLIPTCLALMALALFGRSRRHRRQCGLFLAWVLPYGMWLYVAQNPDNPRHVLPLLPPLLIGLAAGLNEGQQRLAQWSTRSAAYGYVAALLLIGALGCIALPLARQYHTTLPTRVQLVRYVAAHYDPGTTRVYCWWSRRFFQYYAPAWKRSLPRIERPLTIPLTSARTILVTSDFFAGGFVPQDFRLEPIKVFSRNRYLHAWLHHLALYRLEVDDSQRADTR
jgi:4-amino-4-deoxy-L-arabinose transferase-like glycosyltransferase